MLSGVTGETFLLSILDIYFLNSLLSVPEHSAQLQINVLLYAFQQVLLGFPTGILGIMKQYGASFLKWGVEYRCTARFIADKIKR